MASGRQLLIPLAVLTMGPFLSAQRASSKLPPKQPALVLEIIPANQSYRAGDAIVVKYRFTNRLDKTVCFPPPDTKTQGEGEGYVETDATDSKGDHPTLILEGFYPRGLTDQQLLNEANENWIKLAPGLSYVTETARPLGNLSTGNWKLQSKYIPPDIHGRASLVEGALGCTPPQVSAVSKSVNVTVITNPGDH
jgi:hypothetical protein